MDNNSNTVGKTDGNLHKRAVTDADKALAILKSFHDLAHNSEKSEGVTITKDWDINTLTIMTKEGHNHFGQMNSEDERGRY